MLSAARPQHWIKNLFVLAPLLFGLKLGHPEAARNAIAAFAAFCLISSALYLLNDILDREADRRHPEKQLRAVASGRLPVSGALAGAALFLAGGLALAWRLGTPFLWCASCYCLLSSAYSLGLKRVLIVDAMTIAAGFVLRVEAGAIAAQVRPTHWIIACTFVLALFLALAKRRNELVRFPDTAVEQRQVLARYSAEWLGHINYVLLGVVVVCYLLYTVSPETVERFGTDALLYGTAFVIYGLLRYTLLLQDSPGGGAPERLVLRDAPLLAAVAGWVVFNAAVIYRENLFRLMAAVR